jgi:uncharacterized membrane protein
VILGVLDSDDFWYQLVYLLHILSIVVGLGPTFVYPVFASLARRRPPAEAAAVNQTTLTIAARTEWVIYLIPVFGILMVLMSDDVYQFDQAWITWSFVAYFAGLAVAIGLHMPNLRRLTALEKAVVASGGPPAVEQEAELEQRGKRAGMYGGSLHLITTVLLVLMVWKPGAPV